MFSTTVMNDRMYRKFMFHSVGKSCQPTKIRKEFSVFTNGHLPGANVIPAGDRWKGFCLKNVNETKVSSIPILVEPVITDPSQW